MQPRTVQIHDLLGRHLPENAIRLAASALFFGFGAWMLGEGLAPGTPVGPVAGGATLAVALAAVTGRALLRRRAETRPVPAASDSVER